jgi:hypothetical protein
MRRIGWLVVLVAVASGCGSGSSNTATDGATPDGPASDGATPDGPADGGVERDAVADVAAISARAYNVEIDLSYTAGPGEVPEAAFPKHLTLSMFLDEDAGQPRLRTGGQGRLAEVTLTRISAARLGYEETSAAQMDAYRTSLQIVVPHPTPAGCQSVNLINFASLTLDRTADVFIGAATGFATYEDGDSVGGRPFVAQLRGTPDRELTVAAAARTDVHPFDPVTWLFPEALAVDRAELRGPATVVPLNNLPAASPSGFSSYPHLLPFAQTLTFAALPALIDLGGNRASPALTVTTLPEPPAFVADGFESAGAPSGIVAGDVAVVTSVDVPGISGAKALLVGPGSLGANGESSGGRFTAKLLVPAGATASTRVRANFHFLSDAMGSLGAIVIRLASPGGEIVEMEGPTAAFETVPTALPRFPQRSPLVRFEAPLPAGTGDVVYLDIENLVRGCGALLPPGALVVDDLRVE